MNENLIPVLQKIYEGRDVQEMEFRNDLEIDKESAVKYAARFGCTDVRIAQGRFMNRSEYELWRKKVLETKLP
jgi:hypothetical protein